MRCIKPNATQCSGIFDENLVQSQLISSGSIAYQQLMRIGFPSHMSIAKLFDKFKSNIEFGDTNPKDYNLLNAIYCFDLAVSNGPILNLEIPKYCVRYHFLLHFVHLRQESTQHTASMYCFVYMCTL